jgi:predicted nucleic acid-binding Zn finger protein
LLQRVLPYAQKVTVGLIGRSLPHFYVCHCGAYRFTLVLSGWARNDWSKGSAFDLLAPRREIEREKTAAAYNYLIQHFAASVETISIHTLLPETEVLPILFELCRAGRVIYDPVTRTYRLRELFAEPLDIEGLFAPDPRIERAQALLRDNRVALLHFGPSEVRKRETRATATVKAGDKTYEVIVSVDDEGSVRFGVCQCKFFQDNILSRGPCEHILAARYALDRVLSSQEGAPNS